MEPCVTELFTLFGVYVNHQAEVVDALQRCAAAAPLASSSSSTATGAAAFLERTRKSVLALVDIVNAKLRI